MVTKTSKESSFIFSLPSVAKWCFLALGAIIPLWFFPSTTSPILYNKLFLVSLFVVVGALAWLGSAIQKGTFMVSRLPWALAFYGGFLIVTAVSALFAAAPSLALHGIGTETSTLFVWMMGGLILIGIPFVVDKKQDLFKVWAVLGGSFVLVGVFFVVHTLFDIQFLPWAFARSRSFNFLGSWSGLGMFFGFVAALLLPFLSFRMAPRIRIVSIVAFAAAFVGMAAVNYFWSWIALGFVAIAFLALLVSHLRERALVTAPIFVLLLVVFGVLAQRPLSFYLADLNAELELAPNFSATAHVIRSVMQESPFLGVGPNHFSLAWDKFKPAAINLGPFWGARLETGMSPVSTAFAEGGAFGGVTLVFFIGLFVWHALKNVGSISLKEETPFGPLSALFLRSAFAGSLFLFLLWFLAPLTLTLILLTFFTAGLYLAVETRLLSTQTTIQLFKNPRLGFLISLAMILLMVGAASVIYVESSRYLSHLFFARGVRLYNDQGSVNGAEQAIIRAVNFDNRQDRYWRALAELARVKMERALSTDAGPEEASRRFQEALSSAITYAQAAISINKEDGLNWVAFGRVYELAAPFVEGAGNVALANYAEAKKRLPHDPSLLIAESRVHMSIAALAQRQKKDPQEELAAAKKALQESIALKPNYAQAHFQLAQLFAQEGNLKEAIARAEDARLLSPDDVGVLFQLGLLYYQKNEFDRAKEVFEQTIIINTNYANARYFLGLIYEGEGNIAAAKDQFQRILALNPENAEVKQILRNLNEGRSALAGIAGPLPEERDQPPVEEKEEKSELEE